MVIYRVIGSILFTVNYKAAPSVGSYILSSGSKHILKTKHCPKEIVRDSQPGCQNRLQQSFYPAIPWATSLRVPSPLAEHCHFRYSFQRKGRVSRKAGMIRAGDLSTWLSQTAPLTSEAPQRGCSPASPSLRSATSSSPATAGGRRVHRCRGKPAGSRSCSRGKSELTSRVRAGRRENVREAHTRGQPGLPPPQGTLERPGRPASTVRSQRHKPKPRAQRGKAAQHTEFPSAGGRCPKRPMGSRVAKSDAAASRLLGP